MTLPNFAMMSGLPSNYQNGLYWQYFMATLNDYQRQLAQRQDIVNNMLLSRQNSQNTAMDTAQFDGATPATQTTQQTTTQTTAPQTVAAATAVSTTDAPAMTQTKDGKVYIVADGKDDGKISAGQKFKNFCKGVGNFFKGMVCDEEGKFSWKRTLTTVGIAAGAIALTVATGGAAAPFLIAGGVAMGAVEVGKGAYKAATAKTDAEAEAAWQSIGSGVTGIGLSVAGAKGSLKAAGVKVPQAKGIKGAVQATVETFRYSKNGIVKGYKYVKANGIVNSAKAAGTAMKTNWETAMASKNAHSNAMESLETKYDAKIAKNNQKMDKLLNELVELEKNPVKNAKKIAAKKNEWASLNQENVRLNNMKNSIPENPATVNNKARIKEIDKQIEELRAEIKDIKQTLPEADVSSIEKEIAAKISMRNSLSAQQTPAGARQLQLDRLNSRNKVLADHVKSSKDGVKDSYKKFLAENEMRINEVNRLSRIEQAERAAAAAKAKLPKYEAKLKQINESIENVKNNTKLSQEEKLTALKNLAKEKANATKLYDMAKSNLTNAKRMLHFENLNNAVAQYGKTTAYSTVAIRGGNVVKDLNKYSQEDVYAMMNGFPSYAVMQQYLGQMEAAQQAEAQAQQTLAQTAGQNASQNTAYSQYTTNPYNSSSIYSTLLMQEPTGTGLEFEDVYVSPYPPMYY